MGFKVIFLDIDGVLNQMGRSADLEGIFDSDKILIYKKLIDVNIFTVITSTRRMYDDERKKINKILLNYNIRPFYIDLDIRFKKRSDEIKEYLNRHFDILNYVIIDDNDLGYSLDEELFKHLVLVDGRVGLTEEDVLKAQEILGNKL